MDLISKDNRYKEYERRILTRDQLKKAAKLFEREYIRTFGEWIEESFTLKIECIRLKKMISYCQLQRNHGNEIDSDALATWIESEMAPYKEHLRQLHALATAQAVLLPQHEVMRIHKIYRTIAKQIHPDMNPTLFEREEVQELWARVTDAYEANDLEALEELQVVTARVLEEAGGSEDAIAELLKLTNLEERIKKIDEEIEKIRTTDPYLYRIILNDEEACREKREELTEECKSYTSYRDKLQEILKGYGI